MRRERLLGALVAVTVLMLGSPTEAQVESGTALDAPPPPTREADQSASPPPSGEETSVEGDLPIPPPPEPSPGYGTAPIYPQPSAEGGFDAAAGVRLPSNIATRLRVLDSSLQVLAARGSNRIVDGVLSLVMGTVSIGLGVWARRDGYREEARYVFLLGSVSFIRGGLDLGLSPNPRTAAIRFSHMPMRTLDEAKARMQFGEAELEDLARRSRIVRMIDASLSVGTGIAVVPIFLHAKDYRFSDPLDYFIVVTAGISVITGIINLVSPTDAERRWSAYEDLRDRLAEEEETEAVARDEDDGPRLLSAGAAPVRGGFTAGLAIGF